MLGPSANTRSSSVRIYVLELGSGAMGFEPQTSYMPSAGSMSTGVHPGRSPSDPRTGVRSRPARLRYLGAVLPARRRTLVAGARAPWLPAARAMLGLPRLCPDGDVTAPHSGERPVPARPSCTRRDQGRPGRKGRGCSRSDVCATFTVVMPAVRWTSSKIPSLTAPLQAVRPRSCGVAGSVPAASWPAQHA